MSWSKSTQFRDQRRGWNAGKHLVGVGLCLAMIALEGSVQAQLQGVSNNNDGTINTVPIYSGSFVLENSTITQSNHNTGIGMPNPSFPLHVYGDGPAQWVIYAHNSTNSTGVLLGGRSGTAIVGAYGPTNLAINPDGGNVGIRMTAPQHPFQVFGTAKFGGSSAQTYGVVALGDDLTTLTNVGIFRGGANSLTTGGNFLNIGGYGGIVFTASSNSLGAQTEWMRITTSGAVGIGTPNPSRKLHIAGDVQIDGSIYFGTNTTAQSSPYSGNCGADYAESVDVSGERKKYSPGDILVIDPDAPGSFLKSAQPYSTMVAGVYSTQPGFVGRKHPAGDPESANEVPMAMVGRVPTKVSTENGAIKLGDLLVTSSTMGYAMKGTDRSRMLGAVIGKALGSLDSGTGTIEVLVTLQ